MSSGTSPFGLWLDIFKNMPSAQLLFFVLFAATWLIGGNIVIAMHYRRIGKPSWSGFRLFAFPFKNFNAKEWILLSVVAALAIFFANVALYIGNS